jgi:aspartate/methionine/tyrosine aminotransferase
MVGIDGDFQKNWEFKIPKMERDDLLVICNPLNPASTIYKKQLIEDAIEQAENAGATVIIDEAYKGLAFEKLPRYENAIRLRSFSKEFNMEGWRLGYAIAPDEIVGRIVKFNQITTTCVPIFTQNAGRACLENERKVLGENAKVWQSRSLVMQKILKKLRFEFTEPESGIYIFASHPDINDSNKYAMKALEKGVAIAPGTEFGNDKFIRICVNQPEETLKLAAECLEAALR